MKMRTLLAAAIGAALLAACADPGANKQSWNSTDDYGTPGAVVHAYSSVGYYPACGNEVLSFDGHQWYPYEPMNSSDLPASPLGELPAASAAADALSDAAADASTLPVATGPVGAVAAPGPGDDVGTLVIYENDLAYWESDSGRLSRWLTNQEITYNWVC